VTLRQPILLLLLGLALVRGLLYASIVPPWQAPDEPAQFERTRAALSSAEWRSTSADRLPWYDSLVQSLFTFDFWDFLPGARRVYSPDAPLNQYLTPYQEAYRGLYGNRFTYALMGWPLFLARNLDITLQLYLVRLNTVLMNTAIIGLAYLITRTIFPHDPFLIFGVPLLILFNPQHTHLLATVNNGNLAELFTAAALYFMVKGVVQGFSGLNILAVMGFSFIAMWTKATAYFLPFTIAVIGLFYLWRYRGRWPWLLPLGLILVGAIYLFSPERLKLLTTSAWAQLRTGGLSLDPIVPITLFRSFWAMPGWLTLQLHPFWYQLLLVACILAAIGLIIFVAGRWPLLFSKPFQPRIQALVLLAVAALVAVAVLLGWSAIAGTITYRQGRSAYPVIVPISLFLMLGWRQLIPASWRNQGLLGLAAGLILFDSVVLFHYLIPFFYSRY